MITLDNVLVIRAREEPAMPGYRCIGFVSNTCWPEWFDWVLVPIQPKRRHQQRLSGGKVRARH